jgi:hypothetical protein
MSKSDLQTKNVRSASFLGVSLAPCLQIFRTSPSLSVASVRHRHVSASVRRYLRMTARGRKRKNTIIGIFLPIGRKRQNFSGLRTETCQTPRRCAQQSCPGAGSSRGRGAESPGRARFGTSRHASSAKATPDGPTIRLSAPCRPSRNAPRPAESRDRPAGAAAARPRPHPPQPAIGRGHRQRNQQQEARQDRPRYRAA